MTDHDITSMEQLRKFADTIISLIKPHPEQAFLITLSGNLGAGKTTFTQELGALLGIESGEINSPTYVIEQRYPISKHSSFSELVHIDAYRLEQEGDPVKIGLDQTLADPTKLIIIEWPEKIQGFLKEYKKTDLSFTQDNDSRLAQVL